VNLADNFSAGYSASGFTSFEIAHMKPSNSRAIAVVITC